MEKSNNNRVFNSGENLDDFSREILVICPKCESCALIVPINTEDMNLFAARRLICLKCAFFREWNEKTIRRGSRENPATDGYFGEALWLQIACGNEILWAYNLMHLIFIENYVCAKLRERRRRFGFRLAADRFEQSSGEVDRCRAHPRNCPQSRPKTQRQIR